MKRLIIFIFSLCCCCLLHATISKNELCHIADTITNDSNVEIWLSNQLFSTGDTVYLWNGYVICPFEEAWGIFIDNHPLHNWGHACQYIFVNTINGEQKQYHQTSPPRILSEQWTIYKSAYSKKTGDKSISRKSKTRCVTNTYQQRQSTPHHENPHLFAIIIDYCGYNPYYNHERFWNDCVAMYTTLRINGYPKDNIYVAMPTEEDFGICTVSGDIIPSSTDLDGDGISDVRYDATTSDVNTLFDDISHVITGNDILTIYLVGHGNAINDYPSSIYMGNLIEGDYNDSYLMNNIASLDAGILNLVVQRSYTPYLQFQTNAIADPISCRTVASFDDTEINIDDELTIDEYTVFWTQAVNGEDMSTSDLNADGYVSMYEAHSYAISHNTTYTYNYRPDQFSSPICLMHDLTISNTLPNVPCILQSDLYIKDNDADFGHQPNTSTHLFHISPDIWVEDLSGNVVNAPISNESYNVCVRVRNRGFEESIGDEVLHVNWLKSTIGGAWPNGWVDGNVYDCNGTLVNSGGEVTPPEGWSLPVILAGDEYIARIPWTAPDLADYEACADFGANIEDFWHYCFLARLYEDYETPGENMIPQPLNEFVLYSNNVAARNVTKMRCINNKDLQTVMGLYVVERGLYTLDYRILTDYGDDFINGFANVNLYLDDNLYANWTGDYFGMQNLGDKFLFTSPSGNLQGLSLTAEELYTIKVEVENGVYTDFTIDLTLKDTFGVVVGGCLLQYSQDTATPNHVAPMRDTNNGSDILSDIDTHEASKDNVKQVVVINALGQIVSCPTKEGFIGIKNLPNGVYTIMVEKESGELNTYKILR